MTQEIANHKDTQLLIVEDSAVQRVMLQRLLTQEGFDLVSAKNGEEGLQLTRTHRPALVITDISMPIMDGYALCRAIKDDPELCNTPVLLLTSLDDPSEVLRGLDAGADNYLTKPVEDAHLLERIHSLVTLSEEDRRPGEREALRISFAGETHIIHAGRRQTMNLLLSTYENAVRKNRELIKTQTALNMLTEHLEDEVRTRTRQLEVANRVKTEFICNMSHEVRTPMNAIIGMTDMVLSSDLNDQQREMLGIARTASDSLLKLLNGLLDFSQMEQGAMKLRLEGFALRATLRAHLAPFLDSVQEKGLAFCCRVSPDVPEGLVGDFPRVGQVLDQLLGNAIKFTERGSISLEVTRKGEASGPVNLRFAVTDSGIGIEEAQQEWVFESFNQGDGSKTRKYGGTGLGLSLAKRLVDIMGGQLSFDSQPGNGSVFHLYMTFPLDADHTATPESREDGLLLQSTMPDPECGTASFSSAASGGPRKSAQDMNVETCLQGLDRCAQALQAGKTGEVDRWIEEMKEAGSQLPDETEKLFLRDILRLAMAARNADVTKALACLEQARETLSS